MYTVSGMSTRKQFKTLEEAVLFRDGNPAIQIFEEDAYGNVKKVLDRDINKATLDIMAQKKAMESKASSEAGQAEKAQKPRFMQDKTQEMQDHKQEEKVSGTFRILLIILMVLILLYVAYRIVGNSVIDVFRNIGGLVVMLA
ncbi:hypothetical protein JW968_05150 [Candidatus Woesearchaeota archaeon]|nr:hypothetical protein [Candidatus Woesearchaeota archaeon]